MCVCTSSTFALCRSSVLSFIDFRCGYILTKAGQKHEGNFKEDFISILFSIITSVRVMRDENKERVEGQGEKRCDRIRSSDDASTRTRGESSPSACDR